MLFASPLKICPNLAVGKHRAPPGLACDSAGVGNVPEPAALPSPAHPPASARTAASAPKLEQRRGDQNKARFPLPPTATVLTTSQFSPQETLHRQAATSSSRAQFSPLSPAPTSPRSSPGKASLPPDQQGYRHSRLHGRLPTRSCYLPSAALPAEGAAKPQWLCTTSPANALPPPASRHCSEEQKLHRRLPSQPGCSAGRNARARCRSCRAGTGLRPFHF